MAQPVAYTPIHAFLADSASIPFFPGQALDVEFSALKATTDQVRTNLALIQRDDGMIANGVVTYDSLDPALTAGGIYPLTLWVTATAYVINQVVVQATSLYKCIISHTSGVFATDLTAAKWQLLAALPQGPQGIPGLGLPAAAGTVAAPSIAFSADLDTGMWSPAADTIGLSVGGVERFRLNSTQAYININSAAAVTLLPPGTNGIYYYGSDGSGAGFNAICMAGQGLNGFWRTNGTTASPTRLASNDTIGALVYRGAYTSGGTVAYPAAAAAAIRCNAAEDWTDSTHLGTLFFFLTTPLGTAGSSVVFQLNQAGIASTSSTTGAAIVTGGLGVSGAAVLGTYLQTGVTTVAGLPAAAAGNKGARYFVTDGNTANAFRGVVTGGGALNQWVVSDGTNWLQG